MPESFHLILRFKIFDEWFSNQSFMVRKENIHPIQWDNGVLLYCWPGVPPGDFGVIGTPVLYCSKKDNAACSWRDLRDASIFSCIASLPASPCLPFSLSPPLRSGTTVHWYIGGWGEAVSNPLACIYEDIHCSRDFRSRILYPAGIRDLGIINRLFSPMLCIGGKSTSATFFSGFETASGQPPSIWFTTVPW